MSISRSDRDEIRMVASALEMDPVLLPYATELLADLDELGSDAEEIVDVLRLLGVGPTSKVVDLGSGKGAVAVAIARAFDCDVLGIELHQPFIPYAEEAARKAGLADRCRFLHGDIGALVGTIDEADVVVYAALGETLGRLDETMRMIRLYAKPGGHVVISDCCLRDSASLVSVPPGFESYVGIEETRRRLIVAGDHLVNELLDDDDDDEDDDEDDDDDDDDDELDETASEESEAEMIARRAHALAAKYPEINDELLNFVRTQREEYDFLDEHTISAIWVVQRSLPANS